MKTVNLKATIREERGKENASQLRETGKVPCVIYGNGENISFFVSESDIRHCIYTPNTYLIEIELGEKKELAIIHDMQFHPVNDNVLHIDFYRVEPKKTIQVALPIVISGNAEGVKLGGKLQVMLRKLVVRGLLENIPESLSVDISSLGLGKSIFVSDLSYSNLTITTPKTTVVCAVKMTRAARGSAATAEEQK